jgi:hypothetical protein
MGSFLADVNNELLEEAVELWKARPGLVVEIDAWRSA